MNPVWIHAFRKIFNSYIQISVLCSQQPCHPPVQAQSSWPEPGLNSHNSTSKNLIANRTACPPVHCSNPSSLVPMPYRLLNI